MKIRNYFVIDLQHNYPELSGFTRTHVYSLGNAIDIINTYVKQHLGEVNYTNLRTVEKDSISHFEVYLKDNNKKFVFVISKLL